MTHAAAAACDGCKREEELREGGVTMVTRLLLYSSQYMQTRYAIRYRNNSCSNATIGTRCAVNCSVYCTGEWLDNMFVMKQGHAKEKQLK